MLNACTEALSANSCKKVFIPNSASAMVTLMMHRRYTGVLSADLHAMPMPTNQPLNETDLDRLEVLLDAPIFANEGPLLDELQAMLCAIASGPAVVMPSEWLPAVLGDSVAYESEAQANEVLSLVMALYNDIATSLAEDGEISPILYPVAENSEELDFAAWADAYIYGSQVGGADWYGAAGAHAEDLSDLLEPFFLLNGSLREDAEKHKERWLTPSEEQLAVSRAQDALPELVSDIYRFWQALAPVQSQRRETAKVGRNEACPCGSGKKYKQCCGSPEKLH
jgi:uncharacterized protein